MLKLGGLLSMGLVGLIGCAQPVPRVPPPAPGYETSRRDYEPVKPMPAPQSAAMAGPQPFYDEPLLIDSPPEAKRFVDAYRQVGRPRIVVFVNRTLEGHIIPASGDRNDRPDVYLQSGEYDEIQAKSIDYGMMEMLMTDWMSADNQVAIVSPIMARKKLTAEQIRDLESGRLQVLSEVAKQLDADILVQVQARPTRQTGRGLELRILADAIDIQRGESLARGAVDLEPPLDKIQLNRYTRFLSRKLMDGMTTTWMSAPAPAQDTKPAPPPSNDKGLGPRLDSAPPATQNP